LESAIPDPAWTVVRRRWPADPGARGGRSNRVGFGYEAHVPGEIAEWDPELPASLAADVGSIEAGVADLARRGDSFGSLLWPLLRSEAIASSRIEGLGISHRRLALADAAGADDALAHAVLGNLDALRRALDLADGQLTVATLLEVHAALLRGTRDAEIAGRLRTSQNWIGGRNLNPREAAFVPPPETEVERLLADLCVFCERDDMPPVLQAAIAHVQFETIHPFADGNGRVGRALVQLVLRRRGLTQGRDGTVVCPPISLALAARLDAYVRGLVAFRRGDHRDWFEVFLSAVHGSVRVAERLARRVTDLQERWRTAAGEPRRDSAAAAIIAGLPERPIVDLAGAHALGSASREATRRAIDRLAAAGVLTEITGKRRLRRWEAADFFTVLDEAEGEVLG
jgi:Fic family protein